MHTLVPTRLVHPLKVGGSVVARDHFAAFDTSADAGGGRSADRDRCVARLGPRHPDRKTLSSVLGLDPVGLALRPGDPFATDVPAVSQLAARGPRPRDHPQDATRPRLA